MNLKFAICNLHFLYCIVCNVLVFSLLPIKYDCILQIAKLQMPERVNHGTCPKTHMYGYDKNMRAFCKVVENMEARTTIKSG